MACKTGLFLARTDSDKFQEDDLNIYIYIFVEMEAVKNFHTMVND